MEPTQKPHPQITGLPDWVAHTPSKTNPLWNLLADHTLEVARRAEEFARPFDKCGVSAEIARYLGLLHDLGKFTDVFQQYLWLNYLADNGKAPRPTRGSAPHKQMGAIAALMDLGDDWQPLMQPLYGHHGGMENPETTSAKSHTLANKTKITNAEVERMRERAAAVDAHLRAVPPDLSRLAQTPHVDDTLACEMYLRMLYSCLVDADALDTERHKNPDAAKTRAAHSPASLAEMRDVLRAKQDEIAKAARDSPVNRVRREVYESCLSSAQNKPGVFSLTVPTGGGKTRSSLAFALEHIDCHSPHAFERVIYAIPFTSIVDQTAGVFRDVSGDDPGIVLEHHSAIDPDRKFTRSDEGDDYAAGKEFERWRTLAAQNWDAPLIVTTTVQLFESLFSNRPSACRKLHRLAKSVIILDEVQTLPPTLLTPLIDGLKTLAQNFGATIVLCTATQPALEGKISRYLDGFPPITQIVEVEMRKRHFETLRRVTYRVETEKWDWTQVADTMRTAFAADKSCLCIVNTRRHALAVLDELDGKRDNSDVFHLSTLMCGKHRREVLATVRERLKNKEPLLLVSTQLIEAGVDVDFPQVLRAIAPLDRIIQAAGRCNREGLRRREDSEVIVFTPLESGDPGGIYKMAMAQTQNLIERMRKMGEEPDFDDADTVTEYFRHLFNTLQGEVDKKNVQERRGYLDYPEVARRVRLIEEDTVSVLVRAYDEAETAAILLAAERMGGMTRDLWRRAQPLSVSIYERDLDALRLQGTVSDAHPGELLVWEGAYDEKTGIPLDRDPADIVYRDPMRLITST